MCMDTIKCPLCGKAVMIITYGGGRIGSCCDRLVYNGKPLRVDPESLSDPGHGSSAPAEKPNSTGIIRLEADN